MMYRVYHGNELDPQLVLGDNPHERVPWAYHEVAKVTAESLEEVFSLTNTIERPWWEHPQVTPVHIDAHYRSTSVGDVIVQGEQMWVVEGIGFRQVRWTLEDEPRGEEKEE